MYWFRNANGSCEYGDLYLSMEDDILDFIYDIDESNVHIFPDPILDLHKLSIYDKDVIYKFLYDYNESELFALFKDDMHAHIKLKEFNESDLLKINIDDVISSFLVFLYSNSTFESKFWQTLKNIIISINSQDTNFWRRVCFGKKIAFDKYCDWFKEFVTDVLREKVKKYLYDESCFKCYKSLIEVKEVIQQEQYNDLEKECCEFFDIIAIERIDNINKLELSLNELKTFSVDVFFFYSEYFKLANSNPETVIYINNKSFDIYMNLAHYLIKNKHYVLANNFLNKAKKCSTTKSQSEYATEVYKSIEKYIKREEKSEKMKDIISKFTERFIMVINKITLWLMVICFVATVTFLLLTLIGLIFYKPVFSVGWKVLLVSLILTIASAIVYRITE